MSTMQFIASLVHAVAWPTGIVIVLFIFRRVLRNAIENRTWNVTAGPVNVAFGEKLKEVMADLSAAPGPLEPSSIPDLPRSRRAESSTRIQGQTPLEQIVTGHASVEAYLRTLLQRFGTPPADLSEMVQFALRGGLITRQSADAIEGLSVMRNLAIHSPREVTAEQAADYSALVDGILYAMRQAQKEKATEPETIE